MRLHNKSRRCKTTAPFVLTQRLDILVPSLDNYMRDARWRTPPHVRWQRHEVRGASMRSPACSAGRCVGNDGNIIYPFSVSFLPFLQAVVIRRVLSFWTLVVEKARIA